MTDARAAMREDLQFSWVVRRLLSLRARAYAVGISLSELAVRVVARTVHFRPEPGDD